MFTTESLALQSVEEVSDLFPDLENKVLSRDMFLLMHS
jgi:hypothetical protein